jgi:hypothetical protein
MILLWSEGVRLKIWVIFLLILGKFLEVANKNSEEILV